MGHSYGILLMTFAQAPGCTCCGTSPCLQEDTTEFIGIEVSGIPAHSHTYGSHTFNYPDFNGIYLWASAPGHQGGYTPCAPLPENWRLGEGLSGIGCCTFIWELEETEGPYAVGPSWIGSYGTSFDAFGNPLTFATETIELKVKATHTFTFIFRILEDKIEFSYTVTTAYCKFIQNAGRIYYKLTGFPTWWQDYTASPDQVYSEVAISYTDAGITGTPILCTTPGQVVYTYSGYQLVDNVSGAIVNPVTFSAGTSSSTSGNEGAVIRWKRTFPSGYTELSRQTLTTASVKNSGTISFELLT